MQKVLLRDGELNKRKEHFWVASFDKRNRLLIIELVSLGPRSLNVHPNEVFGYALQKKAAKIVMVRSRPAGKTAKLFPTIGEVRFTDYMSSISDFLRVPIVDHLIINEENYYSFTDTGLFKRIKKVSSYDLSFASKKKKNDP